MSDNKPAEPLADANETPVEPASEQRRAVDAIQARRDARGWWIKTVLQPVLFITLLILSVAALGVAQRYGWLTGGGGVANQSASAKEGVRYICPMMCTPPQSEPGRCPVCAMELVPATSASGGGKRYVEVDPATRRIAKIQTVEVQARPMMRSIRAIGEIRYDEGSLKTISAYVNGRIDRLYADYTGVMVKKNDHLALLYSPKLYSGQVELLLAKKARDQGRSSTLKRVVETSQNIYDSSKKRLTELGMTDEQIAQLERDGKANSRLHLYAPIGGTVIEKLAVEGQYVKEGQPIYKLADLTTVWLMLELFPEDAAAMRYGQRVKAEVRSLPGESFLGRVAFVDPNVDPKTRTVGVRVVVANDEGRIRIGEYATATIEVHVSGTGDKRAKPIYDPELATKFVSPRHPHIIRDKPGKCPVCAIDLVPASELGYADEPVESLALVVPRDAVLMAGGNSVVYVETKPGRFEIRKVVLGPTQADEIVILDGVAAGEHVATRGNFLIDSQMQLAGNPSLIDPTKATPLTPELSEKALEALAKLGDEDRELAISQRLCPVTDLELGSMGAPIKVSVEGRDLFVCCEKCREGVLKDPEMHFAKLEKLMASSGPSEEPPALDLPPIGDFELVTPDEDEPPKESSDLKKTPDSPAKKGNQRIIDALAKLTPTDRALAEAQKVCPVGHSPLGSMGVPLKVDLNGKPVFICCDSCRKALLADPKKHLGDPAKEESR